MSPPLRDKRKRGACGSSKKSSGLKFASSPPAADNSGQSRLKNCGTCARVTRTGACHKPFNVSGSPSGCNRLLCQTQSPAMTRAMDLFFSAKIISPFASSVAHSGTSKGVRVTVTALDFPSVIFSCPTSSGINSTKSLASSCSSAGVSPSVKVSSRSMKASSAAGKVKVRPLGSAFSGHRPPPHFASNTSITLPRASAWSKLGGRMMYNSASSPPVARSSDGVFRAG